MIRVFTTFSGYDSQCVALERLGLEYELVGWSEIDKYAIDAHNALFPQYAERNYGDIRSIDWSQVPDFDLFTYSSPCFVAGTLVLTDRGYIPIEDVKVGDKVLTHQNRYQKVLRAGHKMSSDLYKIKGMAFDEIICTGNHPFYTREMYRRGHKSVRAFREPEWIPAKNLNKKTYCAVATSNESKLPEWDGCIDNRWGHHRIQNTLTSLFNNPTFWYIMGRYIGDGWSNERETGNGITICCGGRNEEKLRDALSQLGFKAGIAKERTVTKYHIHSNELCAFVQRYGKYAHGKRIDAETLALPAELLKSFIEGYTDSDGYIVGNNHKYTSVSRQLIYGIAQCIAKTFSRPYAVYHTKRKPTTTIEGRKVNQKDSYNLVFHENEQKQDHAFIDNGTIWFPIQKVEKLSKQSAMVYNLEVETDNSYTANGVIVHNCTDFSIAGLKQGGEKGSGTRSSLLWECERAIYEKRPKYLVMENVATLMGESFIDLLNKWLKTLEGYGYKNFAKLINAKDYGVPQNRLRTIVVSIHQDENTKWHEIMYNFPEPKRTKGKMSDILENEVDRRYYIGMDGKSLEIIPRRNMYEYDTSNVIAMISGKGYGTKFESIRRVYDINALAPTITTYGGGNREAKIMLEDSDGRKSVRKLTERECFRLMGLNDTEIDAIKATGASRTQQYKMAGNSICVNALSAVLDKLFVHTADKEKRLF